MAARCAVEAQDSGLEASNGDPHLNSGFAAPMFKAERSFLLRCLRDVLDRLRGEKPCRIRDNFQLHLGLRARGFNAFKLKRDFKGSFRQPNVGTINYMMFGIGQFRF